MVATNKEMKDSSDCDELATNLSEDLSDGSNLVVDIILPNILAGAEGDEAMSGV